MEKDIEKNVFIVLEMIIKRVNIMKNVWENTHTEYSEGIMYALSEIELQISFIKSLYS